MPFCPSCRTEYKTGVTTCADDGSTLVDTLPPDELASAQLDEIYATYHEIEADRIHALLEDEGIACYVRSLRRAAFPTQAGSEAPTRVAVPQDQVEKALELIRQARTDSVLSDDGTFLR